MKLANVKKASQAKVKGIVESESSKSKKIISLLELGYSIKEIGVMLEIRYNFAYNVASNHINVNGLEVEATNKRSKKQDIIDMHLEGKSNKEISIELKTNYNYVYNTIKEYKAKQAQ